MKDQDSAFLSSGEVQGKDNKNIQLKQDSPPKDFSTFFNVDINQTDQDLLEQIAQPISGSKAFFDFWLFNFDKKSGKYIIDGFYMPGILERITKLGFAKKYLNDKTSILIKVEGPLIHEVTPEKIKDAFSLFFETLGDLNVKMPDGNDYSFTNGVLRDLFLKRVHLVIYEQFLQNIPEHKVPFLQDSANSAFFPFLNGLVEVTKKHINTLSYDGLESKCIWKNQLIPRKFKFQKNHLGKIWPTFIKNICNQDSDRIESLRSAIGYLLHCFKIKSQTQAVIIYDEHLRDPKSPQGGTGKGLLVNGLKILKPVAKIDGKEFRAEDKFHYQQISPGTSIAWIDDPKSNFDFSILYSALTDGLEIERKNQNKVSLSFEESPKFVLCSNVPINCSGSSNKRRQFIIELSDHYSKQIITGNEEPIVNEHKGLFFSEKWNAIEWNAFFSYMLKCVQSYMKYGLKSTANSMQTKTMISYTNQDFHTWAEKQMFNLNQRYNTTQYYKDFTLTAQDNIRVSQRTFSNWLKVFSVSKGWDYENFKSNNLSYFLFSARA